MTVMRKQKEHVFNPLARKIAPAITLSVFLLSLLATGILQHQYYHKTYDKEDLLLFESTLKQKELTLKGVFEGLTDEFVTGEPVEVLNDASERLKGLAEQEDLYIFYFKNGRLRYWSDHSVPLGIRLTSKLMSPLVQTLNATYVAVHQPVENGMLLGLILIRTEYPYENDYLRSAYQKDFELDPGIDLVINPNKDLFDVTNEKDEYLFSLDLGDQLKKNRLNVTVSMFLFMVALISMFVFLALKTDAVKSGRQRLIWFLIGSFALICLFAGVRYFEIPAIIFESEFFSPAVYASLQFSSLGHLWVFMVVLFMVTLLLYWFFYRSGELPVALRFSAPMLLILLSSIAFAFAHHLGRSLVMDSTISFEAYKLNSINQFTFIGLLILVMANMIFVLLFDKAMLLLKHPLKTGTYMLILLLAAGVQIPFLLQSGWPAEPVNLLFLTGFMVYMIYLGRKSARIKFSRFVVLLFMFTFYFTHDLQKNASHKVESQKEIELAKLSSEHDAVAEMLFADLSDQLRTDSLLIARLKYEIIDIDRVFEYLQRAYFSGYWTKYDLHITICRPSDRVFIEPPVGEWFPCYEFFDNMILEAGLPIRQSDFYYQDNLNGRISYIGAIPYVIGDDEISLFIELDSKIISEELGYPSLLLRERQEQKFDFSYAKYNEGKLITSNGDYSYRQTSWFYTTGNETYESFRSEGYDHSIYNVDEENTVIVSTPSVQFVEKVISFSYLFAFLFIVFSLAYLVAFASHIRANVTWDFKNKIQYSMIGVLFFTFIVICSGTIYFVIQQYRMKHQDNLENTMRSLYIELVHKVEHEADLRNWSSDSYYNLDELLRKFSNVFYTDINMYDEDGLLLATSRSEIFDQQFLSIRMHPEAYDKLSREDYSVFIHTEEIGSMKYQSAYVPLLNSENNLLAYLNLPYFTEPELLAQEVTNLVVVILNTYVILLLLVIFLGVFLADRITQPLRFIQSRIAQLSLSKNNEKIVYSGNDEIAGLVDEYNYMVDELVKSADLLARSERESAWREMAKQIAHEIKNPLTPMKLNVQHMQRLVREEGADIAGQVEKVSQSLIEQIDSLTFIANEFSDFAKMPKARNRKINLVTKLRNVANLFENSEGFKIGLQLGGLTEVYAYGDPAQFQRMVINLVKNGIQAIPEDREKKISVAMEILPGKEVQIAVTDNGKGIPESIREKLFHPNFTTKSGGMGMGLAISASIVQSMGGEIWYETDAGKGTTFFVKIPMVD
jgi:two-component system, NtrC family, nitrogen regulation sensor histidine kinase NtrY